MKKESGIQDPELSIAIDIGGTFTDVVIADRDGTLFEIAKTPSTPLTPSDGFIDAVKQVMDLVSAKEKSIEVVLHGSTVVTNAILEGKLSKTALITTKGFRHVLEIGRAEIPREENLYGWIKPQRPVSPRDIFEVTERIKYDGSVVKDLEFASLENIIKIIGKESYSAVAISLLHSYANPIHEIKIKQEIEKSLPNVEVSISSEVLPIFREYERAMATVINAAVQPIVGNYVRQLENKLEDIKIKSPLYIMKSNGGIFPPEEASRFGAYMALSGPAAGMSGAAFIGELSGHKNLITIDMGGTSADIALVLDGKLQVSTEARINKQPLALPIIDIHTIGAGGGSIASVADNGAILVGPESAGANPGPASYNKGGVFPTVTDANLVLGRIPPHLLGGSVKLDVEAASNSIEEFVAKPLGTNIVEASLGIIKIVNETMHGALKLMSVERGLDPSDFVLAAFGGAGPVHGGDLMRLLSVNSLIIPRYPGILCANGLLATDLKYDFMITKLQRSDSFNFKLMDEAFNELNNKANKRLALDNIVPKKRKIVRLADFRYSGQGTELSVSFPLGKVNQQTTNVAINNFHKLHKQLYTFSDPEAPVELVNLRVQAFGLLEHIAPPIIKVTKERKPKSEKSRLAVIDQEIFEEVKVFDRDKLCHGHVIYGPAIIDQLDSTTILLRKQKLRVDQFGNLLIKECLNDQ